MAEPPRRFPPPWRVIEHAESFWVQDASGQTVGSTSGTDPLVAKTAGVLLKDESPPDGSELCEAPIFTEVLPWDDSRSHMVCAILGRTVPGAGAAR
jgi:hypothetical protein